MANTDRKPRFACNFQLTEEEAQAFDELVTLLNETKAGAFRKAVAIATAQVKHSRTVKPTPWPELPPPPAGAGK